MKIKRVKISLPIDAELKANTMTDDDFDFLFNGTVLYVRPKRGKFNDKVYMVFPTNIAFMGVELTEEEKEKPLKDLIKTK